MKNHPSFTSSIGCNKALISSLGNSTSRIQLGRLNCRIQSLQAQFGDFASRTHTIYDPARKSALSQPVGDERELMMLEVHLHSESLESITLSRQRATGILKRMTTISFRIFTMSFMK
jgi:hypothetical protein